MGHPDLLASEVSRSFKPLHNIKLLTGSVRAISFVASVFSMNVKGLDSARESWVYALGIATLLLIVTLLTTSIMGYVRVYRGKTSEVSTHPKLADRMGCQ